MKNKEKIIRSALQVGCTEPQARQLAKLLTEETASKKGFNLLYYLGGSVIFCALVWFLGEFVHLYGESNLFFILLAYTVAFYSAGVYLWKKRQNQILGGIACFLALSLIPFTTYAFQSMLGWWPGSIPGSYIDFYSVIKGGWFLMEVTAVTLTVITLRFIRFPLITTILYLVLWFMSLDILPFVAHLIAKEISMEVLRKGISICFGLGVMAKAFLLDRENEEKQAFWAYLFGVVIFWSGLSLVNYQTEWGHLSYCLINSLLLLLSVLVNRKVFIVFGMLGVLNYLMQLMIRQFSSSAAFPIFLSLAGLAVIAIGMLFHRYGNRVARIYEV